MHKTMKLIDYKLIENFILSQSSGYRKVVQNVQEKFKNIASENALLSICLSHYQRHTKQTYANSSSEEMVEKYYEFYNQKVTVDKQNECKWKSVMIEMSEQFDVPPALLARLLLKKHVSLQSNNASHVHNKEEVSKLMKNPQLIDDKRLSFEVSQCILFDVGYGPVTDSIRYLVGLEYEDTLVNFVEHLGIPFQDETELRKLGYDKTPDIKLEIPIAVDGHAVCWIESKASFGTPETHKQYLHDQYYSYLNRFGPGLVIYWFGYVEDLAFDLIRNGILLMDHFPEDSNIVKLACLKQ